MPLLVQYLGSRVFVTKQKSPCTIKRYRKEPIMSQVMPPNLIGCFFPQGISLFKTFVVATPLQVPDWTLEYVLE